MGTASLHTHTHNRLSFRYDCYSPLPYRVGVMGSRHKSVDVNQPEEEGEVSGFIGELIRFREDDKEVRGHSPKIIHAPMFRKTKKKKKKKENQCG